MRARLLVAAGFLVPFVMLGVQPAVADAYPPSGVHVVTGSVSATTVTSGSAVTFSGGGFAPSSLLRLSVAGAARGTTTSSATGAFSVRLTLTGKGAQVLAASGLEPGGRLRVVSVTVTLQGGAVVSSRGTGGLPMTGIDHVYRALGAGLGAVSLGTALVLVARSRRRRPWSV